MDDELLKVHKIMAKHPDKAPVWIERAKGEKIDNLDRNKYLIDRDLSMGQVVCLIRDRIHVKPEQAIFIFVGDGVLPPNTATVGEIYREYKSKNDMLWVSYRAENTFG